MTCASSDIELPFGETVRISFSADLPEILVAYAQDDAGIFTELLANNWMEMDERAVELTLTDGAPATVFDGITNCSITAPTHWITEEMKSLFQ